jgi:hypothetical protein
MKQCIIPVLLVLGLSSCVNTKKFGYVWIPKGQVYYDRTHSTNLKPGGTVDSMYLKKLVAGARAILTSNPDGSFIPSTINFVDDTTKAIVLTGRLSITDTEPYGSVFPILQDSVNKIPIKRNIYRSGYFRYTEIHFVVQALTIPFKYNFKINDSILSNATADFNIGVAFGLKFTENTYRKFYNFQNKTYSPINDYTTNWSFTPGIFIAPTVVEVDSALTGGKVTMDRNVIGLTTGAFFVVGYNSFNLGLSLGFDKTFGSGPSAWIYNGKPWIGLVFAVDVFQ